MTDDDHAREQGDSWFTVVELEINARCNRRCSYCPVSVLPPPTDQAFMGAKIFDRVISELARLKFAGTLSYHLYNEPLLRPDLDVLVAKVRERLPNVFQLLFTNGDLLSDRRYTSLRGAGIDHFIVTRHDSRPISQRPSQTVQFPGDLVIVNRGGFFNPLSESLLSPCYAPTDMLIITRTGDVLLCCDDAERTQVMGNIARQSIEEIWLSPGFVKLRRQLQAGDRLNASDLCARCDNREYFGPGENDHKNLRDQIASSRIAS